jgi:flavin-dependent dehydrogenase
MDSTTWLFVVGAAVLTFAIAAGTIGREAHRLDAVAPRAVYLLDEAVDFVADRLPPESQARLTPAEVDELLRAHLRWLHDQGLQPDKAVDVRQSIDEQVVVNEVTLVAYLLGEAERLGVDLVDDVDAVNVVNAHLEYFKAIGAVGPEAPLDDIL